MKSFSRECSMNTYPCFRCHSLLLVGEWCVLISICLQVGSVTAICFTCFLIRCFVVSFNCLHLVILYLYHQFISITVISATFEKEKPHFAILAGYKWRRSTYLAIWCAKQKLLYELGKHHSSYLHTKKRIFEVQDPEYSKSSTKWLQPFSKNSLTRHLIFFFTSWILFGL